MSAETIALLIFALVGVALFFAKRWNDAYIEQMIDEFEARFPGKCIICSMHRYGRLHGMESKPLPKKHICKQPLFDPSGGER